MKFVSSAEMRDIDRAATQRFAIPSLILMENAGRSVAQEARKMLKKKSTPVAILCGCGNNGGDGFVAARHLHNSGYKIEVYLIGPRKKMSTDTEVNFMIANKLKIKMRMVFSVRQLGLALRGLEKSQLIIDAIFGIGLKRKLDNFYCRLFEKINDLCLPVLSVDVPSGLDADRGMPLPVAIQADKTVTMGLAKRGFRSKLAKKYLGKVIIADISLPRNLL